MSAKEKPVSKPANSMYDEGFDRIWGKKSVGCPNCGSTGLHACPGKVIEPWTDEEKARFEQVVRKITMGGTYGKLGPVPNGDMYMLPESEASQEPDRMIEDTNSEDDMGE